RRGIRLEHGSAESIIRDEALALIAELRRVKEDGLNRSLSDVEMFPIELEGIANLVGVRLEEADSGGQVLGSYDPARRTISVAGQGGVRERRYTQAHEIAHAIFDPSEVRYRERLSEGSSAREWAERRAEVFACELLMPAEPVRKVFHANIGMTIDERSLDENIAYFLSQRSKKRTVAELRGMTSLERQGLFAITTSFGGIQFKSLCEVFGVSKKAMAIRLGELSLVH
ncbi:MAG TPA: ImmA/IrrE family metallo-endopeptidase, partial [Candidatus Binataceae bacterium]|nr:ImmA/IrrE family metallo-endopeptidase [Candidatus Binataceae bacterium]